MEMIHKHQKIWETKTSNTPSFAIKSPAPQWEDTLPLEETEGLITVQEVLLSAARGKQGQLLISERLRFGQRC